MIIEAKLGHGFVLMHMNRSGRTISWAGFQSAGMATRQILRFIGSPNQPCSGLPNPKGFFAVPG